MSRQKTSAYWKKRFEQLENASNACGQDAFRQVEPAFDKALRQIENQIEAWYGRFAVNNGITMQEAKKLLSADELEELKWDVEEYIKYGRENALNPNWIKQLENASAKYHISRLEALKVRTQQSAEVAFGNELDVVDSMVRKVFTENYYHSIFEVQKGLNIGWNIGQVDENKLEKLISKPWAADGKNFSDRIWQQKAQLVNELHQQLTRNCILGKAPDGAINAISKKFNTTKNQAGRLVMTEQAYFHSVSQKEAFNDLDVEEFEIVATLDSHTSEICQEMDGKHFSMKDYEPGTTAPPFHVWCRSITVPYFEDNYGGERAARDAEGNTYYISDDMTYKDWKKKYVKDAAIAQDEKLYQKYKSILGEKSPKTLEEFQKIRYNNDEWNLFKAYSSSIKSGELTPLANFDLYKQISQDIDKNIVGLTISNGVKITSKSNHFIARVIGSVEQRRNGVSIEEIVSTLKEPVNIMPVRILKNSKSQRLQGRSCLITINPETGNLVQVNPIKRRGEK